MQCELDPEDKIRAWGREIKDLSEEEDNGWSKTTEETKGVGKCTTHFGGRGRNDMFTKTEREERMRKI